MRLSDRLISTVIDERHDIAFDQIGSLGGQCRLIQRDGIITFRVARSASPYFNSETGPNLVGAVAGHPGHGDVFIFCEGPDLLIDRTRSGHPSPLSPEGSLGHGRWALILDEGSNTFAGPTRGERGEGGGYRTFETGIVDRGAKQPSPGKGTGDQGHCGCNSR